MEISGANTRSTNGHGSHDDALAALGRNGDAGGAEPGETDANPLTELLTLPGRLMGAAAGALAKRIPPADLDERDPDYIRESLPGLWLLASIYWRGEVRGMGNIPEQG